MSDAKGTDWRIRIITRIDKCVGALLLAKHILLGSSVHVKRLEFNLQGLRIIRRGFALFAEESEQEEESDAEA